jgi:hypothetical protein
MAEIEAKNMDRPLPAVPRPRRKEQTCSRRMGKANAIVKLSLRALLHQQPACKMWSNMSRSSQKQPRAATPRPQRLRLRSPGHLVLRRHQAFLLHLSRRLLRLLVLLHHHQCPQMCVRSAPLRQPEQRPRAQPAGQPRPTPRLSPYSSSLFGCMHNASRNIKRGKEPLPPDRQCRMLRPPSATSNG